jgi:uroporphyrinogen-III decarboxylase
MVDGVRRIGSEIGRDVFLEVGCNSSFRFALGVLGLQEGLMFLLDYPEVFAYLLERTKDQELEYLKAMAWPGVRGTWITDIWVDLISEPDYRRLVLPVLRSFVDQSRALGLRAHYYPTGKASHLIDTVNEVRPDAFHLEEYADVDIAEIRHRLDPAIALYGNVHALDVLQKGPVSAIRDEAKRQIDACLPVGPFVLALGTEVTRNTPPRHVDAMIEAAHGYG